MAISRKKKEALLAGYVESLKNSNAIFLTNYQGVTVNDMTVLRRKLREVDGGFSVVKNTLAKRALNEAGLPQLDDLLEGPVGIGFSFGDPPPVAKTLVEFAKGSDSLQIKGGLLDNTVLNEQAIKDLAALPPMEVLRAQLLGVISAPATQLAGVVASGVRQVINVVKAYADTAEDTAEEETAAAQQISKTSTYKKTVTNQGVI